MHLQLFVHNSRNIKFPIPQFWFSCYGYWNAYASFKSGIKEDKAVTINVISALAALLNAKIVWINIPKNCIKKSHQVGEHQQHEKQDEGHKPPCSSKI